MTLPSDPPATPAEMADEAAPALSHSPGEPSEQPASDRTEPESEALDSGRFVLSPLLPPAVVPSTAAAAARKRPKPGERRVQILQTLAQMLEQPGAERVTTAALAARLEVSEAALYRHFASKAQMFEGLIEFIEHSVFSLIGQIAEREAESAMQVRRVLTVLLQFAEKNPGMTRVMVGDALVFENERLVARMNQFFDRIESQLRQSLRERALAAGSATPTVDANVQAAVLTAFVVGRMQRYSRAGFKRSPTEQLDAALAMLLG